MAGVMLIILLIYGVLRVRVYKWFPIMSYSLIMGLWMLKIVYPMPNLRFSSAYLIPLWCFVALSFMRVTYTLQYYIYKILRVKKNEART